jgi:hypothetical protein
MKIKFLAITLTGLLLLTACTPASQPAPTADVVFIQTSAAMTVIANFTLTAQAASPTPLPALTDTPVPPPQATPTLGTGPTESPTLLPGGVTATAQLCDYYSWDNTTVDVNIPDGTQMTPGQDFVKTWKIKNAGICTWGAGYKVVYAGYTNQMSGVPQAITGVIGPGQEVQISVNFKAPTAAGQYVSAWTLANANGRLFFGLGAKPLYVKIVVKL